MLKLLNRGVLRRISIGKGMDVGKLLDRRVFPFLIVIAIGFLMMFAAIFVTDEESSNPLVPGTVKGTGNTLSGVVKINGTVLTSGGSLILYGSESGRPLTAGIIQPNGTYVIEDAPAGPVQLCFSLNKGTGKNSPLTNSGKAVKGRGMNRRLGFDTDDPNVKNKEIVIARPKKSPATQRLSPEERASREELRSEADSRIEMEKLAESAAKKYGRIGLPDAIKAYVSEGSNAFDVELQAPIADQK